MKKSIEGKGITATGALKNEVCGQGVDAGGSAQNGNKMVEMRIAYIE
jgi:hypothetical protein